MYRSLSIAALALLLLFASTTMAAEKVVVVPLGGSSNPNVVDTSSGDATAADILKGKKAWVQGIEVNGTLEFCDQAFWDIGEWDCDYYCTAVQSGDPVPCKKGCDVMFTYFKQRCP